MKRSRDTGGWYTPAGMAGRESLAEVREYYGKILPFFELESVARRDLGFWRSLARRWRPARILEVGAGIGRITTAVARNVPAVGIDISLEMLARACRRREPGSRARFVAADMRRVAFAGGFDLIIAASDPFSHLTSTADRRQALRSVAEQLSPNGHFVLEGLYRRRAIFEPPERRIRHAGGVLSISETWRPVGTGQLWNARYRYCDRRSEGETTVEASFVARAWDPGGIRRFFASCGLAVEELWADFDRRPFSRAAPRLVVVARRSARRAPARRG
jgi:SAM-dependent methyltransferase